MILELLSDEFRAFRDELKSRYAVAPRYVQRIFLIHLVLRPAFILMTLLIVVCVMGNAFPLVVFGLAPIWIGYKWLQRYCTEYRCRHDPSFHYAIRSVARRRANYEVLKDGTTVRSRTPLRGDNRTFDEVVSSANSGVFYFLSTYIRVYAKVGILLFLYWLLK